MLSAFLQDVRVGACHNLRVIPESTAAESAQHENVRAVSRCHGKNTPGALLMKPLQCFRGHADRRSALGIVLVAGGLAQIGRSTGNDIHLAPVLPRHTLREIRIRLADHDARGIDAGIGMKHVPGCTVNIIVRLPQEPPVKRRIQRGTPAQALLLRAAAAEDTTAGLCR